MDLPEPVPAKPEILARTIAAIANTGGGTFKVEKICGDRDLTKIIQTALNRILPPPSLYVGTSGFSQDRNERCRENYTGFAGKRSVLRYGIFPPAEVFLRIKGEEETVSITPGFSLCTVEGEVLVIDIIEKKSGEEGILIKALSPEEIIRIAGPGG